MTTLTTIILTPEGEEARLTTLEQLATDDWTIAEEDAAIRAMLAQDLVFVGGGGAGPFYLIERGPLQVECLSPDMGLDALCSEWERFCRGHRLEQGSADQVLADVVGPDAERAVVEWIMGFIRVWETAAGLADLADPMMSRREREERSAAA